MHHIQDKKRWWAANFCTPHVKCMDTPMTGILFGIGAIAMIAVMGMLFIMAGHASAGTLLAIVPTATVGRSKQLIEKENEIKTKSELLGKVFEEAKCADGLDFTKVKCLGDGLTTVAVAEKARAMNDELTALGKERDTLAAADQAAADQRNREAKAGKGGGMPHSDPNPGTGEETQQKSFGQLFVESDAYKNRNAKATSEVALGFKTLFERSNGWEPESTRSGLVVPYAVRPIQVVQLIPSITTGQAAYKYMEETTLTDTNVVEKAEGAAFGEAALKLTERAVIVEKIPVWIPVTDEQLEDQQGIAGYLDNRLRAMIMRRLDRQILLGDGSSPNLQGILNIGGSLQTQAKGSDDVPTAIRKAMTKVMVTGQAMPSGVVLHPNDWQDIVTLKTTDGVFIWGQPSQASIERIWGLAVAQAQAITENTGLTGDFATYALLVERSGMDVQVGMVDDDFIKGKKAVRATIRVALVWTRPSAFCTVTGI